MRLTLPTDPTTVPSSNPTGESVSEQETVGEQVETAVAVTFDALQLLLTSALGAVIGFIAGALIIGIGTTASRRYRSYQLVHQKLRRPALALATWIGAWIGFAWGRGKVAAEVAPNWLEGTDHFFLIVAILLGGYLIVAALNGVVNAIYLRVEESSAERAARVQTQVQIVHRILTVVIWILAVAAILLTFPGARAAGASLLASAGLISVVAGLAAQSVLGNVFAGLQLAFSDSMRVGDVVSFRTTLATVEEITLTYVVLSVWDGRRIIVPSTTMTSEPFENWTRRAPEMTGTIDWTVDWAVPVKLARKQLEYLLGTTDLWDGRTGVLQVAEAINGTVTLRAIVSAADSGTLTDLKNYLREAMVAWIQTEAPQAIPHQRRIVDEAPDISAAAAATAASVDARIADQPPAFEPASLPKSVTEDSPENERTTVISPREMAEFARTPIADRDVDMTIVMEPISQVHGIIDDEAKPAGYDSAIFHGSEEAQKRLQQMAGPGEKAYEERNRKIEKDTAELKAAQTASDTTASADIDDARPDSAGAEATDADSTPAPTETLATTTIDATVVDEENEKDTGRKND